MTERRPIDEFPIALRRGGMDTLGHVNNTVPFRDMKQTRISCFGFPKRGSIPLPAHVREAILLPRSGWL